MTAASSCGKLGRFGRLCELLHFKTLSSFLQPIGGILLATASLRSRLNFACRRRPKLHDTIEVSQYPSLSAFQAKLLVNESVALRNARVLYQPPNTRKATAC